jgi:hypothetical protein
VFVISSVISVQTESVSKSFESEDFRERNSRGSRSDEGYCFVGQDQHPIALVVHGRMLNAVTLATSGPNPEAFGYTE